MESVQDRMKRLGAYEKIASFMQKEKQDYSFKRKYERGTNERLNREIRRLIPKGSNLNNISDEEVKRVESWVNAYPREVLGFATSEELFRQQLILL